MQPIRPIDPRHRRFRGRRTVRSLAVLLAATVLGYGSQAGAVAMDPAYCHVPGFMQLENAAEGALDPNIFLTIDNSGSMREPAYVEEEEFNPAKEYYGYWDPKTCYEYQSNRFQPGASTVEDPGSDEDYKCDEGANGGYPFSGNFLNWAFTLRMEVVRKVLVGGRYSGGTVYSDDLARFGDYPYYDYDYEMAYCFDGVWDAGDYTDLPTGQSGIYMMRYPHSDYIYLRSTTRCDSYEEPDCDYGGSYQIHCDGPTSQVAWGRPRIDVPSEPTGVIQELAGEARWGVGIFNTYEGGEVIRQHDRQNISALINDVRNIVAETNTPHAESLYEFIRYHQYLVDPYYSNNNYNNNNTINDPWYDNELGEYVPCRDSYILVLTDGEPTQDHNLPYDLDEQQGGTQNRDYDGDGFDPYPPDDSDDIPGWPPEAHDGDGSPPGDDEVWDPPYDCSGSCSDYLDDVALWANTTDLRPDLDGKQNVASFYIYAFGRSAMARYVMWNAAKNGAFIDKNGNDLPDQQNEWDEDGDLVPDGFFLAENGSDVENAFREAIGRILKRTSSGTSVDMLSTDHSGATSLIQAFFNPEENDGFNIISWTGYIKGLWLDSFGNFREDQGIEDPSDVPELVLDEDRVIEYYFNDEEQTTYARLYEDDNGDGIPDGTDSDGDGIPDPSEADDDIPISQLSDLLNAGRKLWERSADDRDIYTNLGGSAVPFVDANEAVLAPFVGMNPSPSTAAADLINYIRGEDLDYARPRQKHIADEGATNVWKLGDIINSSPTIFERPQSNYDLTDHASSEMGRSYIRYKNSGKPHSVIFAGANDGMLHAFNLGIQYFTDRNGDSDPVIQSWFDPTSDGDYPDLTVGDEVWGFIPQNALGHLKWLMSNNYCHAYYVDNSPRLVDAKIFPNAHVGASGNTHDLRQHESGWGTVMFVTMRLGCKFHENSDGIISRPSVLALDVTDPLDPQVIWEFTHPDLGFTTSVPALVRVSPFNSDQEDNRACWYAVFGSGPDQYDFTRSSSPKIFVKQLYVGGSEGETDTNCVDETVLDLADNQYDFDYGPINNYDNTYLDGEYINSPLAVDHVNHKFNFLDKDLGISVEAVYATTHAFYNGDYAGRILRINTDNAVDPQDWRISNLFVSEQPFSTEIATPEPFGPAFTKLNPPPDESNRFAVKLVVGTGRFYELEDLDYVEQNIALAINDPCWMIDHNSYHQFRPDDCDDIPPFELDTDLVDVGGCFIDESSGELGAGCSVASVDALIDAVEVNGFGWYFEFVNENERALERPFGQGDTVILTTYSPNETQSGDGGICEVRGANSGTSRVYILDASTGIQFSEDPIEADGRVKPRSGPGNKILLPDDKGQIGQASNPNASQKIGGFQNLFRPVANQ